MNPNYKALLQQFNDSGVRYLVIGAYAVMAYTEPRYTKDLDIAIDPSPENARRAFDALNQFGAPLTGLAPEDFTNTSEFYRFKTKFVEYDIHFGTPHIDFNTAWTQRATVNVEGLEVPIVGSDHLTSMKREAGRPQDLLDLEKLETARTLEEKGITDKVRSLEPDEDLDIDDLDL